VNVTLFSAVTYPPQSLVTVHMTINVLSSFSSPPQKNKLMISTVVEDQLLLNKGFPPCAAYILFLPTALLRIAKCALCTMQSTA
jgi:hypothetical protein